MTTTPENSEYSKLIHEIARSYSPLGYFNQLYDLVNSLSPSKDHSKTTKYELHSIISKALMENYNGEETLKYKLFESHCTKQNIVGAFEIRVNNSRLDFLTINGSTTSYEIKSELDTLAKLEKQMSDYLQAFEYNYLVVDEKHKKKALDMIPDIFGVWTYSDGKYKKLRKALLNDNLNPETQLNLLTKKERIFQFQELDGSIDKIQNKHLPAEINKIFKSSLKHRYRSRWDFVVSKKSSIFPIDLQFFFNTNIEPNRIYY